MTDRAEIRKRLEEIALDEDSPEDAAWARSVLDGTSTEKPKPPSADGGARPARLPQRNAGETFNALVRDGFHPHNALPPHLRWRP